MNSRFALAVHALTLLAHAAPARMSSEEMSGSTQANPVHLRRVLGVLREAGLVASKPGAHGGWTLAVDPRTTTLGDVWGVVNQDDPILGLRGSNPDCQVGQAVQTALVDVDQQIRDSMRSQLDETTLDALSARVPA